MIIGKKIKWLLLPFVAVTLTGMSDNQCHAATFQSLREVKDAARNTFYKADTDSKAYLEKEFTIDGAVDVQGGAKIVVNDWEKKAIPQNGNELSVYAKPESERIIGKVYGDTIMSVRSEEDGWTQIESGYLKGYIRSDSLYFDKEANEWADEICPEQLLSDIWNTEVRKEPDSDSNIVEYMEQRRPYDISSSLSGWHEIQTLEGGRGYIEEKNVKRVRNIHVGRLFTNISRPQELFVKIKMTEQDKRLLAAIIYCEARGEVFEGQVAVGSVVMNRVQSEQFPNTISEVIYEDGQFEPVLMDRYEKVLEDDSQISASCYEAVDVIMQGGNNIGDALYFKIGGGGIQIGCHGFY